MFFPSLTLNNRQTQSFFSHIIFTGQLNTMGATTIAPATAASSDRLYWENLSTKFVQLFQNRLSGEWSFGKLPFYQLSNASHHSILAFLNNF
jgi:hypothetical protein